MVRRSAKSALLRGSCKKVITVAGLFTAALWLVTAVSAQDRDKDRDRDDDQARIGRLALGTVIPVRTNEFIDSDKSDNRVYSGIVDQDVRADNGRIVVPRGAIVELMVRVAPDSDLILDLESVVVNGQRYGIKSEAKRIEAHRDDSQVGEIVGAINRGESRGRAVKVPRDTVVTFRLQRQLELGVLDTGSMRDGRHYHDGDGQQYQDRDR
jgi:hypothetical protein